MTDKKAPDPGWNDPPTFSYEKASEIQANASRKRTSLNKRIAFPLGGTGNPSKEGIDPTTPPMSIDITKISAPPMGSPPMNTPPRLPPIVSSSSIEEEEVQLESVLHNFKVIHDIESGDEISKRVQMMENMWKDRKFDLQVQKRLLDLSTAVKEGQVEVADRIQKSMMVDHVAVCSSWMGGIRQIINKCREKTQPENPEEQTES